ncbi:MAG: zf-HC2 domain-containing protein [Pyrinomonadaceae bacterium]
MNCEKCQELLSDLLDGSLSHEDEFSLNSHLEKCLGCLDVRNDLQAIVSFCQTHRGEYAAPPNEKALWLRIRNMVEAGNVEVAAPAPSKPSPWSGWLGRSWQVSLPQLAASVAAIVLIVSLTTSVVLRRWQTNGVTNGVTSRETAAVPTTKYLDRMRQQQQMIDYWNQRVEMNKVRWSPQMRATFDRNLKVIDQAVNVSLNDLQRDPNDEVSEEMLNAALSEKLAILKEFADL